MNLEEIVAITAIVRGFSISLTTGMLLSGAKAPTDAEIEAAKAAATKIVDGV